MRAGLIPSRALQERRIIHERAQVEGIEDGKLMIGFELGLAFALRLVHASLH